MNNKIKIKENELSRLFRFMRPCITPYSVGILGMSLIGSGMAVVSAFSLKYMIEAALSKSNSLLITAGLLMLGAMVAGVFLIPVFYFIFKKSIVKTMASIRLELMRNIQRLPLGFLQDKHSGDFVSRINNDTQVIESVFSENLLVIVSTTMLGLGSIVFMIQLNWQLSLIFIFIGVIMAFINLLFAEPLRKVSDKIQAQLGQVTEKVIDLLNGISVIRMFHLEKKIVSIYKTENDRLVKLELKRINKFALLESTNYLLSMLNFAGLISVGAFLVLGNKADFGTLTALVMLQLNVSNAFLNLGRFVPMLQASLAGAARVFEVLDADKERIDGAKTLADNTTGSLSVRFENVGFSYNPNETILNGFTIAAEADQMTALVGPSGSGKSTIIKLLLGFYAPQQGTILIGGKPVSDYSLDDLRGLIAYVPQESYLFDGTIFENIQYGRMEASEQEVYEAARAANAHDFINQFPEKYNSVVGEGGSKLSGGQRQRISIARAILKNAPILLLDEATSSLDSESEKLIQQALDNLMKKKTVIAIAHRLSTIQKADRILVLNKGKLVEQGRHEELIQNKGLYHTLYNL